MIGIPDKLGDVILAFHQVTNTLHIVRDADEVEGEQWAQHRLHDLALSLRLTRIEASLLASSQFHRILGLCSQWHLTPRRRQGQRRDHFLRVL